MFGKPRVRARWTKQEHEEDEDDRREWLLFRQEKQEQQQAKQIELWCRQHQYEPEEKEKVDVPLK